MGRQGLRGLLTRRRYWNETAGRDFIKQLLVEDDEAPATLVAVHEKYVAFPCLKYVAIC
jgi:hypothetical protein